MAKASYLAGVSLALFAGSALAADLPARKAPPAFVPPPPSFTWTGLYGGVNIGYGFGAGNALTGGEVVAQQPRYGFTGGQLDTSGGVWNVPVNLNGVLGGGQLGYNYQFNPWLVIGFEADAQAADLRNNQSAGTAYPSALGNRPAIVGYMNSNQYVDWFGTVRGRLGLVLPSYPNLMVYGTGGFAYGSVESAHRYTRIDTGTGPYGALASQASGSTTNTNTGYAVGGGVEWTPMSFPSWSIKAEYLYTNLGPVNQQGVGYYSGSTFAANDSGNCLPGGNAVGSCLNGSTVLATQSNATFAWHTVRVGVNWHFNPFEAVAPVVAPTSALAGLPNTKAPPPVVEPFHPFQVRLKMGGVIPTDGTAYITDRGNGTYLGGAVSNAVTGYNFPVTALNAAGWSNGPGTQWIGTTTHISSSVVPMIDVAYYLTRNWAIEAICCVTPHHVTGVGSIQGASVIKTWVFPPSLMLQYHFTNFGAFQPYLGVGVNYTSYWGTRPGNQTAAFQALNPQINTTLGGLQRGLGPATVWGTATAASITPSWGVVGQAGADYMFNDRWGVNVDVKYIMMEPNAHVWLVANTTPVNVGPATVPVNLAVKINPLVISGGLTYRFGADWGVPKILPF